MKGIVLNNFNHFKQTAVDVYPCPATATNLSHTKTNIPSKTFHSVVTELKKICVQRSQELNNSLYSNGSAAPTENIDYISQKVTGQTGTSPATKDILNSTSSSSSSDSCSSSSASSGSDSSSDSDSTPESDSDTSDSSSSESDSNSKEISCDSKVKKISTPTSSKAINDTNSPKLRKPMVFLPLAAYKSLTSSIRSVQTPKYRIFQEEKRLQYNESTKLQETFLHASPKTNSNLKSRSGFHPDENTHYSRHSLGPRWKEIQNQKNGTKARTQHRFSTPELTRIDGNQADWNISASDVMRNGYTDSQSSSAGQENRYSQKFGREFFQLKLKLIRINQKEWRVCPAGGSNIVGTTRYSDTVDRDSQIISENNRSLFGTSNKFASNMRHSLDSQDTFEQIYKKRRI